MFSFFEPSENVTDSTSVSTSEEIDQALKEEEEISESKSLVNEPNEIIHIPTTDLQAMMETVVKKTLSELSAVHSRKDAAAQEEVNQALKEEIAELKNLVLASSEKVRALEKDVRDVKETVAEIKKVVSMPQKDVAALEEAVEEKEMSESKNLVTAPSEVVPASTTISAPEEVGQAVKEEEIISVEEMEVKGNYCKIRIEDGDYINMDLKKISCKFWLNGDLDLSGCFDSKLLLSRLYRCDLQWLSIYTSIQLDLYQKLVTSDNLKRLVIWGKIENPDGSSASVDQILDPKLERLSLGPFPKLEKLSWDFKRNSSIRTARDVKQFVEIIGNLAKMKSLDLGWIPEELFSTFVDFLKKNKKIEVEMYFYPVLSEKYVQIVQNFMEEMIKNPIDKIPRIEDFPRSKFDADLVRKYEALYAVNRDLLFL